MSYNLQQRREKYSQLTQSIKELYGDEQLDALFEKIMKQYQIDITLKSIIGDAILGFYATSEIPARLQKEVGVSADDAQHIFADLQEFLAPVIEREQKEEKPRKEELEKLQKVVATAGTAPPEHHTTVQPMRTMEADMDKIHGYGAYRAKFPEESKETEHKEEMIRSASQEELLTEKPKLADMPTYEEGEK